MEDYVHRIGRTGRAGAKGTSISFFTEKSSKMARDLVGVLRDAKQEIPPDLMRMVGSGGGGAYGGGGGGGGRYRNPSGTAW